MKKILLLLLPCFLFVFANGQKPKDGTYTYSIAYEEWQGRSLGATCMVIIKGDSITIIHDGNKKVSGEKGNLLDLES